MHDLHSILLKVQDMLSTSSDNEVDIYLKLSINLTLRVVVLQPSHSFLICTEKVICFSIFSPIQLSPALNSSAN